MKILIDLQGAQNASRLRGIGRYSKAITRALIENGEEHEFSILLNGLFPDSAEEIIQEFSDILPKERFTLFDAPSPVDEFNRDNAWRMYAAELLREKLIDDLEPDVVLLTSLFQGSIDQSVVSIGAFSRHTPTAVIHYDLIPLLNSDKILAWKPAHDWYHRKLASLRRADLLLGISEYASQEALEHLDVHPDSVFTISSAVSESFERSILSPAQRAEFLARYGIIKPFILYSSAYEERKNFHGLIQAYARQPAQLRKDFQLVLVAKINDEQRLELEKSISVTGLSRDDVVLTNFVPDNDLIDLYSTCHAFVFPSLHEGFGLPVLEAMRCGSAVIGSSTSSIPEVIGRDDALFDPTSIEEIAALIQRVLTDEDFIKSLKEHAQTQAKRFSWKRSAELCLQALSELVQRRPVEPTLSYESRYEKLIKALSMIEVEERPLDLDVLQTASAIARNEKRSRIAKLRNSADVPLNWRLEGPFDSSYSLALVNREIARAIQELGHNVILHSTEGPGDFAPNAEFLRSNPDLALMNGKVKDFPHSAVDVVSRNLYPPRVSDMQGHINLLHQYAWEETGFPRDWVKNFNEHLDGIACVSTYVEKVLIDNGVRLPMLPTGNGVDHWERIQPSSSDDIPAKRFRFLHVSSCFPRKGVDVLLKAYGMAFTQQDDVSLVIKTFPNPHNTVHQLLTEARQSMPQYPDVHIIECDMTDEELKALYEQCQVLVAPSRAEGFGLPMAEAMLSGLPVITTGWGGQLDFCNSQNSWLVDYDFAKADTHFKLFGSVWAEPKAESLTLAMKAAFASSDDERKAKADAGRNLLLGRYRWKHVAEQAVQLAHQLRLEEASELDLKIGWITSWKTPCGIASYSEHLISSIPLEQVHVLASHVGDEPNGQGQPFLRCWSQGKDRNNLNNVSALLTEHDINTVVIQFNYGFFSFAELSDFIDRCIETDVVVIVMLHSTTDPQGNRPNLQLSELQAAFSKCHRLLVHSTGDLNRLKKLGLIDNVSVIPHGVLDYSRPEKRKSLGDLPTIASYGFCLPHKGLPELVEAVGLLRDAGNPVRLKLVNACYPTDPQSLQLIKQLEGMVRKLGLGSLIEMHWDYLSDAQSLALLSEADLLVFAYQKTGESSSAAARYGLATRLPVAVTPLSIFDDIEGAAFRLKGTSPQLIANGITEVLSDIASDSPQAQAVRTAAESWCEHHSYPAVSEHLTDLIKGLHLQKAQRALYN